MLSELTTPPSPEVINRLQRLCAARGLNALADHLGELGALVAEDVSALEQELAEIRSTTSKVRKAGAHLLDLGGKRLRPICVLLASRLGTGYSQHVLELAVAVELVHTATLLHDDVIDVASHRRGNTTARLEFGNAASIFAGDWLLIEALRRVSRTGSAPLMEGLLDTIDAMIAAESLQLEVQGKTEVSRDLYYQVAEGKSATLFRWAMTAGAAMGGLDESACDLLGDYGLDLGVAFQIVDDLLDLRRQLDDTGKAPFIDLQEGKVTLPVILGMELRPSLRSSVAELFAFTGGRIGERPEVNELCVALVRELEEAGAFEAAYEIAESRVLRARKQLASLEPSAARDALDLVAQSSIHRDR